MPDAESLAERWTADQDQPAIGPPSPSEMGVQTERADIDPETPAESAGELEASEALPEMPTGPQPISRTLSLVLMGIAAFALFSVMMRIYKRRGALRRAHVDVSAKERITEIRQEAQGRASPEQAAAEAVDMVNSLIAQLDARAVRLESLVDRAEAAIAQLDGDAPTAIKAPSASGTGVDPVHRRVYQLADEGRGPVDIAKELGQPTGQIELILALRKRA